MLLGNSLHIGEMSSEKVRHMLPVHVPRGKRKHLRLREEHIFSLPTGPTDVLVLGEYHPSTSAHVRYPGRIRRSLCEMFVVKFYTRPCVAQSPPDDLPEAPVHEERRAISHGVALHHQMNGPKDKRDKWGCLVANGFIHLVSRQSIVGSKYPLSCHPPASAPLVRPLSARTFHCGSSESKLGIDHDRPGSIWSRVTGEWENANRIAFHGLYP